MKTTLTAVALLSLLVLACGKDEEEAVAGATPSAARATVTSQSAVVATPGFETLAPVVTGSSPVPAPQALGTRLEIESVSGRAGLNVTAAITMHEATQGLAGFVLEVSVADPGVARIVGVDLSGFGLSDTGPLPATVILLSAVDLSGAFEGPFERESIATLDLELLSSGETEIILRVLKLDDDNGDVVSAEVVQGQLSVTDAGAGP